MDIATNRRSFRAGARAGRGWIGAVLVTVACLAGCGSPLAGQWHGTLDIGPVAAWPFELTVDEDGRAGRIVVTEKGKAFTHFRLCTIAPAAERQLEASYDAGRPNCDVTPDPSDRRTLRGTVGESVLFGEIWRDAERIGFFRAFRSGDAAALPEAATPT